METTTKQAEIMEIVQRLKQYNTSFEIDNLFEIMNDIMDNCNDDLNKGYYEDAKHTLNKMYAMFYVIKNKFPQTFFEDIDGVTSYIKLQHENNLNLGKDGKVLFD